MNKIRGNAEFNCCGANMIYVYIICKNNNRMYFLQCLNCGKTAKKFLSHKDVQRQDQALPFDLKLEEFYKKNNRSTHKRVWHNQNREKAWVYSDKVCGECKLKTELSDGLIHHTSYPHGIYERNVTELIDEGICVWVHKLCHDKIHTANSIEEFEKGFYKTKGKCKVCGNIATRGWEIAKNNKSDVDCICQFCVDSTMNYLKIFVSNHSNFSLNQLRTFFEETISDVTIKNRRKRVTKLLREGFLEKDQNSNKYIVNQITKKYFNLK